MNTGTDISFCELRAKDVVNACDGRKLGRVIDLVFNPETGVVCGIVTPYCKRFFFSRAQEIFIPWRCIRKLGEDIILVDVPMTEPSKGAGRYEQLCPPMPPCPPPDCPPVPPCPPPGDYPSCDHRCDKCMLFDCAYRWKKPIK